ncbi:unnamed protein product [Camellia sinensis]
MGLSAMGGDFKLMVFGERRLTIGVCWSWIFRPWKRYAMVGQFVRWLGSTAGCDCRNDGASPDHLLPFLAALSAVLLKMTSFCLVFFFPSKFEFSPLFTFICFSIICLALTEEREKQERERERERERDTKVKRRTERDG